MRHQSISLLLIPILIFITACGGPNVSDSKLIRLIDILDDKGIIDSPLKNPAGVESGISLYPPDSIPLSDAGIRSNPFGIKRKIKIGGAHRNILLAPSGTVLRFPLNLKNGGILEFGGGMTRSKAEPSLPELPIEKQSALFKIEWESGGILETLYERQISISEGRNQIITSRHLKLPKEKNKGYLILTTEGPQDASLFWFNPVVKQPEQDCPNVILISIDTLRADHLHSYGYKRPTSPNIDKLAEDGVLFSTVYAPSPWTLPSHVSMMTGLYTVHHRGTQTDLKMDEDLPVLSDLFRSQGYLTAAFTGGGFVSSDYGFSKGFDLYHNGIGGLFQFDSAEQLYRRASHWIKKNKENRFFLFLHTYQPHSPYACPEPYGGMFLDSDDCLNSVDLIDYIGGKSGLFNPLSDREHRNIIALYDGEIRYTDERLIGDLVTFLKASGQYNRTLLIVTSDHGEEFREHGGWGHGHSLYNESIRVPLIIKFPFSRLHGKRIDTPVSVVDILPTLKEEIGLKSDKFNCDGKSLLPILNGRSGGKRDILTDVADNVLESRIPMKTALINGKIKMILQGRMTKDARAFFRFPPPAMERIAMFDLLRDPEEKNNIFGEKTEEAQAMIRYIDKIYSRNTDFGPNKMVIDESLRQQMKALGYIR